jgi:CRISPR/Cas system-associated exonuclease Cas4 (RecB family)
MFFPGTVTDRVVRDWLANDPERHRGAMPAMVAEIMEREEENEHVQWRSLADRKEVLAECQEAVQKIEPSLRRLVVPYEYDVDFRFQSPLTVPHPDGGMETILLNGAMDIIVRDNKDRWFVFDVKHTRNDDYWRKTEGQLSFYDLATQLMFGKGTAAAALLQPLCRERVKAFTIDNQRRAVLLQRLTRMAYEVFLEDFAPRKDSAPCKFCDVRHACSKFQPIAGSKRVPF